MEIEDQDNTNEDYFKNKFRDSKWISLQRKHNNCSFKTYIDKDFYNEHQSCGKKFRCFKKNPTKSTQYLDEVKSHCKPNAPVPEKQRDYVFDTAIPNTVTCSHEGLGSRVYNCKLTGDGTKALVTTQTGTCFFDITDPSKLELKKVALCPNMVWTITDAQISTDNKFIVHGTMNQYIHLYDITQEKYTKQFNLRKDEGQNNCFSHNLAKTFSLDLSGDNTEIIVGANKTVSGGPIQIYDLEKDVNKATILAHKEDVNSVCYLDKANTSLILSASDDGTAKLWDTRALKGNEPAGIYYGHVSGLTSIESKKDGRYFLTNSKDQSMKLWDLRKTTVEKKKHPLFNYDYRCEILTQSQIEQIKDMQKYIDYSVMTFWGHQVHLTLIRCHFSPLHSTGQRYVYTGSFDGRIYIYDTLTGKNIVTLELPKEDDQIFNCEVVRDCVWHPYAQCLFNTSFLGCLYRWDYTDPRDCEVVGANFKDRSDGLDQKEQQYVDDYLNKNAGACRIGRGRDVCE